MKGLMLNGIDRLPDPLPEMSHREAAPPPAVRRLPGPHVNGVTYQGHRLTLYVYRAGAPKPGHAPGSMDTGVVAVCLGAQEGGREVYFQFAHDHLLHSCAGEWLSLSDTALYAVFHLIAAAQTRAIEDAAVKQATPAPAPSQRPARGKTRKAA